MRGNPGNRPDSVYSATTKRIPPTTAATLPRAIVATQAGCIFFFVCTGATGTARAIISVGAGGSGVRFKSSSASAIWLIRW